MVAAAVVVVVVGVVAVVVVVMVVVDCRRHHHHDDDDDQVVVMVPFAGRIDDRGWWQREFVPCVPVRRDKHGVVWRDTIQLLQSGKKE